jgi:hypothetical protein
MPVPEWRALVDEEPELAVSAATRLTGAYLNVAERR